MRRSVLFGGVAVAVLAIAGIGAGVVLPHIAQSTLERDIATFRASLPPGASLTYTRATPHAFSRSASLDAVELRESNGSTLAAGHVDLAPDGPHRLRHLHATAVSLHVASATKDITLTAATLDGSDLRDDATPLTLTPASSATVTEGPTPAMRAAAVAQHLSAGTLRLDDVRATIAATAAATDGPQPQVITARSARLTAFGPQQSSDVTIDGLAVTGLSYTVPATPQQLGPQFQVTRTASLSLDSASLEHVRLADEAAYLAAGRSDGPRRLSQPSTLHLVRLVASVEGGRPQAPPASGELRFGDIRLMEHDTAPKTRSDLDVDGIDLPAGHLPALMPGTFDDGRVHGALIARGSGDNATGVFDLRAVQISFDHVGTLRLSMQGRIDPHDLDAGLPPHELLAGAVFSAATLAIADGGLRDALLKRSAAASGSTPEAVATLLSARVQAMLAPLGQAGARLAPGLSAFLAQGGALTIAARPAQPIALSALNTGSMDATIGLLNTLDLDATRTPTLPPLPQ